MGAGIGDVDVVVGRVHQDGVRVADGGEGSIGETDFLETDARRIHEVQAVVPSAFHFSVIAEADERVASWRRCRPGAEGFLHRPREF